MSVKNKSASNTNANPAANAGFSENKSGFQQTGFGAGNNNTSGADHFASIIRASRSTYQQGDDTSSIGKRWYQAFMEELERYVAVDPVNRKFDLHYIDPTLYGTKAPSIVLVRKIMIEDTQVVNYHSSVIDVPSLVNETTDDWRGGKRVNLRITTSDLFTNGAQLPTITGQIVTKNLSEGYIANMAGNQVIYAQSKPTEPASVTDIFNNAVNATIAITAAQEGNAVSVLKDVSGVVFSAHISSTEAPDADAAIPTRQDLNVKLVAKTPSGTNNIYDQTTSDFEVTQVYGFTDSIIAIPQQIPGAKTNSQWMLPVYVMSGFRSVLGPTLDSLAVAIATMAIFNEDYRWAQQLTVKHGSADTKGMDDVGAVGTIIPHPNADGSVVGYCDIRNTNNNNEAFATVIRNLYRQYPMFAIDHVFGDGKSYLTGMLLATVNDTACYESLVEVFNRVTNNAFSDFFPAGAPMIARENNRSLIQPRLYGSYQRGGVKAPLTEFDTLAAINIYAHQRNDIKTVKEYDNMFNPITSNEQEEVTLDNQFRFYDLVTGGAAVINAKGYRYFLSIELMSALSAAARKAGLNPQPDRVSNIIGNNYDWGSTSVQGQSFGGGFNTPNNRGNGIGARHMW